MENYDFSGWATKNDLKCEDGRVINKDAFIINDGTRVPLVWNHSHNDPLNVLGHAILENRAEGVYAYGYFNDSEAGKNAKLFVKHGDVDAMSIWASNLKEVGSNVLHGVIREVSLVLAGANPGAHIDTILSHDGLDMDGEAVIYTGENISLSHSATKDGIEPESKQSPKKDPEPNLDPKKNPEPKPEEQTKSLKDIIDTMNKEQKSALFGLIARVMADDKNNPEGGTEMKHNVFDNEDVEVGGVLSHAVQEDIIALAKNPSVGTLQNAIAAYAADNKSLQHGITDIETLFPEYQLTTPGAPEMLTRDQTWIDSVLTKIHKSPIARIRTRQADVRPDTIRAMGYQKSKEKALIGSIKLINRTTDPQTVYVKDKLERDDVVDIRDFDVVAYQQQVMRMALNEELATAILIGDGREDGDEHKISEDHIRPIWKDNELYTIHTDVDVAAAKKEIQGSDTGANFGENYIYAEAIITAALYAREKYKGSGSLDFYCTPHLLNVMLLARDLNGRRIYESTSDLAKALNVGVIHTVEQFEGRTRTTSVEDGSKTKKLLGLFANMADYHLGATKGGEITNFEDFDIDFNQYKYLMETRVSGAMTKVFSAIALEEDVTAGNIAG